jgi:chromosome segregation ATPase
MAFFGNDENDELKHRLEEAERERKKLLALLADERKKSAMLLTEIEGMRVEVAKAKQSILKSRKRQKNSVERANRFKNRLEKSGMV